MHLHRQAKYLHLITNRMFLLCFAPFFSFDTESFLWQSLQSMPLHSMEINMSPGDWMPTLFIRTDFAATTLTLIQLNFEMCGLVLFKWKRSIYAASTAQLYVNKYGPEYETWAVLSNTMISFMQQKWFTQLFFYDFQIGKIRSDHLIHNVEEWDNTLFVFMRAPTFWQIIVGGTECPVDPVCDAPFGTGTLTT